VIGKVAEIRLAIFPAPWLKLYTDLLLGSGGFSAVLEAALAPPQYPPPPASRPGRRGGRLHQPRRPAPARGRSRGERGGAQLRRDVVYQHGTGLAADVDDEKLDARHPDSIGAAESGC
jgi:hypothetical protein